MFARDILVIALISNACILVASALWNRLREHNYEIMVSNRNRYHKRSPTALGGEFTG